MTAFFTNFNALMSKLQQRPKTSLTTKTNDLIKTTAKTNQSLKQDKEPRKVELRGRTLDKKIKPKLTVSKPLGKAIVKPAPKQTVLVKKSLQAIAPTIVSEPLQRVSVTKSDYSAQQRVEPWISSNMYDKESERSVSFSTTNPEHLHLRERKEFVKGSPPPEPSIAEPHGPVIHFIEPLKDLELKAGVSGGQLDKILQLEKLILENQTKHDHKVQMLETRIRDLYIGGEKKSPRLQSELVFYKEQNEVLRRENARERERERESDDDDAIDDDDEDDEDDDDDE